MYKKEAEVKVEGIDKAAVIDSVLKAKHKNGDLNGTVLVVEAGKVIYTNSFGYANFETKDTLTNQSRFRTVGISLQITAMSILMLHDQKKLSIEDEISKYMPELDYKGVKIRHLLNHTSGIPDYPEYFYMAGKEDIVYNEDVIAMLVDEKLALNFEPGAKSKYSDSGYVILAEIVGIVSGMDFNEFIVENIFKPLEMSSTIPSTADLDKSIPDRVVGYDEYKKNIDHDILIGVVGDGGIYSTVADLYKWDQAMYSEKLVSKAMLAKAFTLDVLNDGVKTSAYGFGLQLKKKRGNTIVYSEGRWVGFYTHMRRNLGNKNMVLFLTNQDANPAWMMDIVDDILDEKYFL